MALFVYLIIIAATLIAYKLLFSPKNKDYFVKKGVKYEKSRGVIDIVNFFTLKKSIIEVFNGWYKDFGSEKIFGIYEFGRPMFVVRDPELIKKLTVKDFDFFTDHRVVIDENVDAMFGKSLVSLSGQKWKDMRSTLSPAFTGHKMRLMFDFVAGVSKQTVDVLKRKIDAGQEREFEFKELATKFTVDNIASCAFGIQVNSFSNPENDFHSLSTEMTDFTSTKTVAKIFGFIMMPKVMKMLGITMFSEKVNTFFKVAILDTIKVREQNKIIRHDMINLLIQAKRGQLVHEADTETVADGFATVEESQMGKTQVKRKWDDSDLAAQCFIFFFAGFDTVSTCMSFMGYELACNPDVQQKLYEEIVETEKSLDGKVLTYGALQDMRYMDQVLSEVLRKWPPAPVTERMCVKDYELEFDNKKFTIEKDVNFMMPVYSLHHDPAYFPNPEKFDPERFNEKNKHKIQEYTYMPFGAGPRNCIGSRFALMECKTIFYYLLLNFKIVTTAKTQIPLEFAKVPFGLKPEKGIWVGFESR